MAKKRGRPPIGKTAMTPAQRVARWRVSHPTVSLSLTLQTLRLVNDEALDSLKERLTKAVRVVGARKTLKAIEIVTAERLGARF